MNLRPSGYEPDERLFVLSHPVPGSTSELGFCASVLPVGTTPCRGVSFLPVEDPVEDSASERPADDWSTEPVKRRISSYAVRMNSIELG